MAEEVDASGCIIHFFRHESATARLTDWKDSTAALSCVYSKEKGKGHATTLLQKIVTFADTQGYRVVYLEAQRYGPKHSQSLNDSQLVDFYSQFGFVVVPDVELPVLMHRPFPN